MAQEKTVLLVDDSSDDVELLQRAFRKFASHVHVRCTPSAADAVTYLATADPLPDLVLLDVRLGLTSGFELLKVLKRDPRTGHIPVVMLTGVEARTDIARSYQLGADSYIAKPSSFEDFRYTITGIKNRWLS